MILCHRGDTTYYPENTINSMIDAMHSESFDGVEIDIQVTKDNQWIIYHDETLTRLNSFSNGSTLVKETILKNFGKIEWKGELFNVDLLSDMESINFPKNKILNIEIKSKFNDMTSEHLFNLIFIIRNIKVKKIISSFDHMWVDWCQENELKFGFLIHKEEDIPNKGNFWIVNSEIFNNVVKKFSNITFATYGKLIKHPSIKYNIVDLRINKNVYIDGIFNVINDELVNFFKMIKKFGDKLYVGVFDNFHSPDSIDINIRIDQLKTIKLIDNIISPAPYYNSKVGNLTKEFIQKQNIDIIIYNKCNNNLEQHYKYASQLLILKKPL